MQITNENLVFYLMVRMFEDKCESNHHFGLVDPKELFHQAYSSIKPLIDKLESEEKFTKQECEHAAQILARMVYDPSINAMIELTEKVTGGKYKAQWVDMSLANQLWHRGYKEGLSPQEARAAIKLLEKFEKS